METSIIKLERIDFQWPMENPFIFCAHHQDSYPSGYPDQSPKASLSGRNIGNDFVLKDGFRMYHGSKVPGFPVHPHRGFETVTIVLEGFVDHFDSKGAMGRYGMGDVQWLTTGGGVQHCEMFPCVFEDKENPLELFQIWLNLPKKDKFVEADYKMLWAEDIPVINHEGANVRLIAGEYKNYEGLEPAPNSWANKKENKVGILLVTLEAGAELKLEATSPTITRNIYYYSGNALFVDNRFIENKVRIKLDPKKSTRIKNGEGISQFLLLEGEPINEPVIAYGPFVMNTMEEIEQAISDYQRTSFGGWPWDVSDPVHPQESRRFAKHLNGFQEIRETI